MLLFSVHFPRLSLRSDTSFTWECVLICNLAFIWVLHKLISGKCAEQGLAHSKCPIKMSYYYV